MLASALRRFGLLDRSAAVPFVDGTTLSMPLDFAGLIDSNLFDYYERGAIEAFARGIEELPEPPVFVDAGADFGLYTRLLLTHTTRIHRLVAVEPNPDAFQLLRSNVQQLDLNTTLLNVGLFRCAGAGVFRSPTYDADSQARFVERHPEGSITLCTLDELLPVPPDCIALKMDVEGAELDILKGAKRTMEHARAFVIQFEAHPEVAHRSGVDPCECLRFLSNYKDYDCWVFEEKRASIHSGIDPERAFFDQVSTDSFYDVVVCSR